MSTLDEWLTGILKGQNLSDDYTTNAPSYYDDLARRNNLMKLLIEKIWNYDKELAIRFAAWDKNLEEFDEEVMKLLRLWIDDGTFATIINEEIFSWKADKADLDLLAEDVNSRGVSVKRVFGAKGDYNPVTGTGTDDTAAIQAALNSGLSLHFQGQFLVTDQLTATFTNDISLSGKNMMIHYKSAQHTESAIKLIGAGITFTLDGIHVDANKMCNKGIEIENNTIGIENESVVDASDVFVTNIKRMATFLGGSGIYIRGHFKDTFFDKIKVVDCELPYEQGVEGVAGIAGIILTHFATNCFVQKSVMKNLHIEKIYSSDPLYRVDQDGVSFLSPAGVKAYCDVDTSEFINCYGRSIKTQTHETNVENTVFRRTEGGDMGHGEIDAQRGYFSAKNLDFIYEQGNFSSPVLIAGGTTLIKNGFPNQLEKITVHLDTETTLPIFYRTFPRGGNLGRSTLRDITIDGKLNWFVDNYISDDKGLLNIYSSFINEFVPLNGELPALIRTVSSGGTSPHITRAYVENVIQRGSNIVPLMVDRVTGNAAFGYVSAKENIGFTTGSLVANAIRSDMVSGGKLEILSGAVAGGATVEIDVPSTFGALCFLTIAYNSTAHANLFVYGASPIQVVSKGTGIGVGQGIEPVEATDFKVWTSASGKLSIKNTTVSSRNYSLFVMASR